MRSPTASMAWLYLPAVLSYYAVSVWLAKSFKTGSLFFALFAASIAALFAIGYGLMKVIERKHQGRSKQKNNQQPPISSLPLRLALRQIAREKAATLAAFLALGLGVLLANLIPILEGGILSEVRTPEKMEQPSLFLFDIQEDQIPDLQT